MTDLDALIAELEEAREVLAGADHTAAKYWRKMRDAEREMHARELHHFEEEQKSAALEAVIARAKALLPGPRTFAESLSRDFAGNLWPQTVLAEPLGAVLNTTPADALRERDAGKFAEGVQHQWTHRPIGKPFSPQPVPRGAEVSTDYTPTTRGVRMGYASGKNHRREMLPMAAKHAFDRWLAAFKRDTEIALLERLAAFRREHDLDHDYWNALAKDYVPGDNMVSVWLDHEVNELRKEQS